MKAAELLLLALVLWTAVGAAGTCLRLVRGEARRARSGALWVLGVWVLYLCVLLTVSVRQKGREIGMGGEQCFDEMCFAVVGVDEMEGFRARSQKPARLLRVRVRVANRGKGRPESEALIRAYLVDGQGRRWDEVRGLSGVRLTAKIAAGDSAVSEPVFRVGRDATGLGLVLTRGRRQPGVLVIGDPDSWLHRPTVMKLSR